VKKTLVRSEKNVALLQSVLDSYARSLMRQHNKSMKVSGVLEVLAKEEPEGMANMLASLADIVRERYACLTQVFLPDKGKFS
jgi:hypothetical protein